MNAIPPLTGLTVTARGQITLRRDLLRHLGIHPGGRIVVEKLPDGGLRIMPETPTGTIADFCGSLKREGQRAVSIDEMNDAIAGGWTGRS